ncbi:hypothetical protein RJ639_003901 [Escallonia herrerae]|uniref:CASP-like protein n=1 Tax=Escallonia herrerae TaxID=1293975 RepID=A0AA88W3C1_9ASTE|nr:hypothetical protein RJ639_003901 [Escallonia herrerae]
MEGHLQTNTNHHFSKKFNNGRSMSDADSQTSHADSFHSPLRSDSPLHSDDPFPPPDKSPSKSPSRAIVTVDRYYSTSLRSPVRSHQKPPDTLNVSSNSPPPVLVINRSVVEDPGLPGATKVGPGDGIGGERRSRASVAGILRRSSGEVTVERAALGFRVCEVVLCLISFSVMAADKTQGWSGDSFDRYKEYRYCLAVTVIGFVYSGFQACDLGYYLITRNHVISHHLRYHFDFLMDQAMLSHLSTKLGLVRLIIDLKMWSRYKAAYILEGFFAHILAYLLISASSSAATRVDDWVSNWGKDEFTQMASASVAMSFLAFVAFAVSSIISGYNLCNRNSS